MGAIFNIYYKIINVFQSINLFYFVRENVDLLRKSENRKELPKREGPREKRCRKVFPSDHSERLGNG